MSSGIVFEGPDAVGKNYLALNIAKMLIELGARVVMTNFPQYFAFGGVIRQMNRGAAKSIFEEINDPYEELKHRAAMFALDRALALLPIIAARNKFPGAVFISDRGPDSNAVTAGFMFASNPDLSEGLLERFLSNEMPILDTEFRQYTDLTAILCLAQNSAEKSSSGVDYRKTLDQLEIPDAQSKAIEIYLRLLPENVIYTKIGGVWQSPENLTAQVLQKVEINLQAGAVPPNEGEMILIGPVEMVGCILNFVPNKIVHLDKQWRKISLDTSDPDGQRKHTLDRIESEISNAIGKFLSAKTNLQSDIPVLVVKAVSRLLNDYPNLLDIVRAAGGEPYAVLLEHIRGIGNREN